MGARMDNVNDFMAHIGRWCDHVSQFSEYEAMAEIWGDGLHIWVVDTATNNGSEVWVSWDDLKTDLNELYKRVGADLLAAAIVLSQTHGGTNTLQ